MDSTMDSEMSQSLILLTRSHISIPDSLAMISEYDSLWPLALVKDCDS